MLAATKVKMRGSEKKRESEREHIQHFLHKTCNSEVSGSFSLSSVKTTAKKCAKKSVLHVHSCCFANYTYCFFWLFSLPSPPSITQFDIVYVYFKLAKYYTSTGSTPTNGFRVLIIRMQISLFNLRCTFQARKHIQKSLRAQFYALVSFYTCL